MEKQNIVLPAAIVIAGILIAGSVLYTSSSKNSTGEKVPVVRELTMPDATSTDHILGSLNASVIMVEYSDLECPYCQIFHETAHTLLDKYGKDGTFAWIYRHFPLPENHPKAPKESEGSECAYEQGGNDVFWKFIDKVYATTGTGNALDIGVYNTPKQIPIGEDGKPWYTEKKPRSLTDAGQLTDIAVSLGLNKIAFESCIKSGKYKAKVDQQHDEAALAGGHGTPFNVFILKKPLSSGQISFLNDTNAALLARLPPGTSDVLYPSKDKMRVAMGGSFPMDIAEQIIIELLK